MALRLELRAAILDLIGDKSAGTRETELDLPRFGGQFL
jgi:hypothetical protein